MKLGDVVIVRDCHNEKFPMKGIIIEKRINETNTSESLVQMTQSERVKLWYKDEDLQIVTE